MSSIVLGSSGYCYVLVNGTPGMCKIGATTLDPNERARQLTASTSAPLPFHVAYSRRVSDVNAAERAMHEHFADRRVNGNREYFQVSVKEACEALDRIAEGDAALGPALPFSELFATFDDDGTDRPLTFDEQWACRRLEARLAEGVR